jgi:heme/copper-type cytochrome/quinol oxidase subunit 2
MDLVVDRRTFRLALAVVVFTVAFIVLVTLVTVWSGATYYTNGVVNNTLYPTASPVPLSSVSTLTFVLSLTVLIVIFILGALLIYYLVKWVTDKLGKPQYWT